MSKQKVGWRNVDIPGVEKYSYKVSTKREVWRQAAVAHRSDGGTLQLKPRKLKVSKDQSGKDVVYLRTVDGKHVHYSVQEILDTAFNGPKQPELKLTQKPLVEVKSSPVVEIEPASTSIDFSGKSNPLAKTPALAKMLSQVGVNPATAGVSLRRITFEFAN